MQHTLDAQVISRNWWALALRGVLAIIFGLIALFSPGIALLAFIIVFAVYSIIDGLVAVVAAFRERESLKRWGWVLFEGILGIAAGILALAFPGITALVLILIIASWAILTGIMEIVTAIALREYLTREWLLVVAGLLSIVFGIILFIFPTAGLLSLLWFIGVYSIVFGVLFIIRAFQNRSWTPLEASRPEAGDYYPRT